MSMRNAINCRQNCQKTRIWGGYQALIDNDYPKAQFCSRDLSIYVIDHTIHNHTTVPLVPIRTGLILDM